MRIKRRKILSYTLVEFLIVLAILGIIFGGALPLWSTLAPRQEVETSAFKLFKELQQGWEFSRMLRDQHKYYALRLFNNLGATSDRHGYKIIYFHGATTNDDPGLPITAATYFKVIKSSQSGDTPEFLEDTFFSKGVIIDPNSEIYWTTAGGKINTLIFTPLGSATTDGQILLLGTNDSITLSKGSYSKTITISPLTGYVKFK
ncbi:MAG: type II secretion system protein [Candidatus Omnitrophica bacterium]|nr:type II secretion system protein [Candidatus Omnitrophota bacterium]